MSTTHSGLRDVLLSAWRTAPVASAAGVLFATWSSSTAPRVFDANGGFVRGLHRGRLPCVEIWQQSSDFTPASYDGGPEVTRWMARAHSGLRLSSDAGDRCHAILRAGVAATRAQDSMVFPGPGNDSISELDQSPLGFFSEVSFSVVNSFGLDNYGGDDAADPGVTPPSPPDANSDSYSAVNRQGATVFSGQVVAVHATGFQFANASSAAKPAVGLMQSTTLSASAGVVQTEGILELSDWTNATGSASLTPGASYYSNPSTPGRMTTTVPSTYGTVLQSIGRALSATQFDISVQPIIQL